MSFIQKYKKDIIDLLKRNRNTERQKSNKMNLEKFKLKINNQFKNRNNILTLKHIDILGNFANNKSNAIFIQNSSSTRFGSTNNSSFLNNKKNILKVDKGVNTSKTYIQKKKIPKIYNRVNRNNNLMSYLSDNKRRFNNGNKIKLIKRIKNNNNIFNCNKLEKNNDKNYLKILLIKNKNIKYKMFDKKGALNFYKNTRKVYEEINSLREKKFTFNKSTFLFTPLKVSNKAFQLKEK